MSAHVLPEGLTRGYSHTFTDMLKVLPMKVLTIKDLEDLDDADMVREASIVSLPTPIDSEDEAA